VIGLGPSEGYACVRIVTARVHVRVLVRVRVTFTDVNAYVCTRVHVYKCVPVHVYVCACYKVTGREAADCCTSAHEVRSLKAVVLRQRSSFGLACMALGAWRMAHRMAPGARCTSHVARRMPRGASHSAIVLRQRSSFGLACMAHGAWRMAHRTAPGARRTPHGAWRVAPIVARQRCSLGLARCVAWRTYVCTDACTACTCTCACTCVRVHVRAYVCVYLRVYVPDLFMSQGHWPEPWPRAVMLRCNWPRAL
jgi:hypothetical protein